MSLLKEEDPENQQGDAGGNRHVCHIEGGPAECLVMDRYEVNDFPEANPVHQIADSPPEDQGKGQGHHDLGFFELVEQEEDDSDRHGRHQEEERDPETGVAVAQEPEGGSCVPYIMKIQKPGYDRPAFVNPHRVVDPELCDLVDQHDKASHPEEQAVPAWPLHFQPPSFHQEICFSSCTQRSQTEGWSGCVPTEVQ